MTRRKVNLACITDDSKRRATFIKRKNGLVKKMDEITTLCGVEACAIIFSENDPQPVIWPSPRGVHTVLSRFRRLPELEQSKKMQNQESFLKERIQKGQEKLKKLRNENRKKELTNLMFQCLNAGQITDNVGMNDLNGLSWLIDQNTRQIERYMEENNAQISSKMHALLPTPPPPPPPPAPSAAQRIPAIYVGPVGPPGHQMMLRTHRGILLYTWPSFALHTHHRFPLFELDESVLYSMKMKMCK
ncbi:agamous-like MADS-box protein AGL80 [Trifolium pratense]|uniref:agamous-like MADS-box protein AGL80 n=1 Tax=Trifolium pratense TaxID=57577 RepID=UPI001E6923CB|nr:agamous-like MADS-box protein AGL80 [Trifolium pratense]